MWTYRVTINIHLRLWSNICHVKNPSDCNILKFDQRWAGWQVFVGIKCTDSFTYFDVMSFLSGVNKYWSIEVFLKSDSNSMWTLVRCRLIKIITTVPGLYSDLEMEENFSGCICRNKKCIFFSFWYYSTIGVPYTQQKYIELNRFKVMFKCVPCRIRTVGIHSKFPSSIRWCCVENILANQYFVQEWQPVTLKGCTDKLMFCAIIWYNHWDIP